MRAGLRWSEVALLSDVIIVAEMDTVLSGDGVLEVIIPLIELAPIV